MIPSARTMLTSVRKALVERVEDEPDCERDFNSSCWRTLMLRGGTRGSAGSSASCPSSRGVESSTGASHASKTRRGGREPLATNSQIRRIRKQRRSLYHPDPLNSSAFALTPKALECDPPSRVPLFAGDEAQQEKTHLIAQPRQDDLPPQQSSFIRSCVRRRSSRGSGGGLPTTVQFVSARIEWCGCECVWMRCHLPTLYSSSPV